MGPTDLNIQHVLAEAFVTSIPVLLGIAVSHWLKDRKDTRWRREREQELSFVLKEHVPHSHGEPNVPGKSVPLTTEGLHYPKIKINGG